MSDPDPVFVRSQSGSIAKMDVPTDCHAAERFERELALGHVVIVAGSDVIEETSRHGGTVYKLRQVRAKTTPATD